MVGAGWTPTVHTYLGRVTKVRILGAVREAKEEQAGDRIEHLKKGEMAEKAAGLLIGSGWLPEPLRTPGRTVVVEIESTDEAKHVTADTHPGAAGRDRGDCTVAPARGLQ